LEDIDRLTIALYFFWAVEVLGVLKELKLSNMMKYLTWATIGHDKIQVLLAK